MAIDSNYEASDFKQAMSALLPAGHYWQYEEGDELDYLLTGLGEEFKTIHEETKVSILNQENNNTSGWKLADYQTILGTYNIGGTVFDKSETPNLIYIDFDANQYAGDLIKTLNEYKLPHTALGCTFAHEKRLHLTAIRHSIKINRRTLRAE